MGISVRASRRWARAFAGFCATGLATIVAAQPLSHAPNPLFHDGMEGISVGPSTDSDASRFLAQATFGPTDADIAHLRAVGYQPWLNEQFAATPTYEMNYFDWVGNTLKEYLGQENRQEAWFLGALGGPDPHYPATPSQVHKDQLRQRVAFALSEILVTSDQNSTLDEFSPGMAYYYDILTKNAFGNYRQLLEEATLSPAMGVYLNMLGNRRADAAQNVHPDENYAREINQLFSIGLVMLNLDGTPQLSGGKQIPTYTQSTITSFAHVFTGWNWYDCDSSGYDSFTYCGPDYGGAGNPPYADNFVHPMAPYETKPPKENGTPADYNYHDNGTHTDDLHNKQLLQYTGAAGGGVLADGGTALGDLGFALDNIYNHPNVAPFVSKQLIQRLVTSNPSPAYVKRIATVFNANRSSSTQLKAVVQAILLDPEARYGQWQNPDTFGKLREPVIVLTHFWRAMNARHACGKNVPAKGTPGSDNYSPPSLYANQPYRYAGYGTAWSTGIVTSYGVGVDQASLDAPTVFNFFKPGYLPSGEMSTRGLLGPEFQQQTDSVIASSSNTYSSYSFYYDLEDTCDSGDTFGDVTIDHAQDLALAGSGQGGSGDPANRLVDAYNHRFMSGQMSPYMRDQLLQALNPIDSNWANGSDDWRLQRIYRALYLVLSSPEYMIQK